MWITPYHARLVAFLVVVVYLGGCVNLEPVGKFAEGAQMLSTASGEFYNIELETDRKLAGLTIDLNDPRDTWLTATTGEKLIAEARRHRAAVAALAQYAASLNEIAEFDDDDEIGKASETLSENLTSLASTLGTASLDDSILASAIGTLAKIYIDVKAKTIIHNKVEQAHPHVKTIVNTLVEDIERQQQRFALDRINTSARREKWFNAFRTGYSKASEAEQASRSIAAAKLITDELNDILNQQPAEAFLEGIRRTAESCLEAHEAIRDQDLKERAGVLVDFLNDARSLLSDLRKLEI